MAASAHLRGIVIAGVLAAVALGLGFVTLGMNQSSSSAGTHQILTLKQRGLASAKTTKKTVAAKKHVVHKATNAHLVAALRAGLPRSIASALAAKPVVVVSLTSASDSVAGLALHEARAGASLAGASFVTIGVDRDGGDASKLTGVLGDLPVAPATLVYVRPARLYLQLDGFNDRTVVQQAAHSALTAPAAPAQSSTTSTTPVTPPVTTETTTTVPAPAAT